MGDLWWLFGDFFGWSGWCTQPYGTFFWSWDASFNEDVGVFDCSVADVSAFWSDFFAIFADFQNPFVVFYALVIAHLSCAWDAVHEVMWIPRPKGGNATFGFSAFVLEHGNVPAFHWSLETFARCYCSHVNVLSVFEDFFAGYGFSQEGFGVV